MSMGFGDWGRSLQTGKWSHFDLLFPFPFSPGRPSSANPPPRVWRSLRHIHAHDVSILIGSFLCHSHPLPRISPPLLHNALVHLFLALCRSVHPKQRRVGSGSFLMCDGRLSIYGALVVMGDGFLCLGFGFLSKRWAFDCCRLCRAVDGLLLFLSYLWFLFLLFLLLLFLLPLLLLLLLLLIPSSSFCFFFISVISQKTPAR
jgi:hypothetical protein